MSHVCVLCVCVMWVKVGATRAHKVTVTNCEVAPRNRAAKREQQPLPTFLKYSVDALCSKLIPTHMTMSAAARSSSSASQISSGVMQSPSSSSYSITCLYVCAAITRGRCCAPDAELPQAAAAALSAGLRDDARRKQAGQRPAAP